MAPSRFIDADNLENGDKIAIYGYGGRGLELLAEIGESGKDVRVLFFVDSYNNTDYDGTPVRKYSSIPKAELEKVKVIVASNFWQEIGDDLKRDGLDNVFIYDPNKSRKRTRDYNALIIELVAIADRRQVGDYPKDGSADGLKKLVLHSDSSNHVLNLPNTIHEGYVNHHSETDIQKTLEGHGVAEAVVLCPKTEQNRLFYKNTLSRLPNKIPAFIHAPQVKYAKAFVMEELSAIYFPIPKCGSSSILALLQKTFDDGTQVHRFSGPEAKLKFINLDEFDLDGYFTFTFMRHPLHRVASLYHKGDGVKDYYMFNEISGYWGADRLNFDLFANFVAKCDDLFADVHFKSQVDFITDSNGQVCADFIGRLETFNADWEYISDRTGIPKRTGKKNASKRPSRSYEDFYSPLTKRLIEERYKRDIAFYNDISAK